MTKFSVNQSQGRYRINRDKPWFPDLDPSLFLFFSPSLPVLHYYVSRYEVKTVDIFLQLQLDFEKQILDGSATLTVERKNESATHLVS